MRPVPEDALRARLYREPVGLPVDGAEVEPRLAVVLAEITVADAQRREGFEDPLPGQVGEDGRRRDDREHRRVPGKSRAEHRQEVARDLVLRLEAGLLRKRLKYLGEGWLLGSLKWGEDRDRILSRADFRLRRALAPVDCDRDRGGGTKRDDYSADEEQSPAWAQDRPLTEPERSLGVGEQRGTRRVPVLGLLGHCRVQHGVDRLGQLRIASACARRLLLKVGPRHGEP